MAYFGPCFTLDLKKVPATKIYEADPLPLRQLPLGHWLSRLKVNRGCGGLVVNTSGFEPHSGRRVVSLSKTYLPPKVLVIPRNRWLRPNMAEKLYRDVKHQTKERKEMKVNI